MPKAEQPQQRPEISVSPEDFELDPNGVAIVAEAAISTYVEASELNITGDRSMQAHNDLTASHMRIRAGVMASALDLIALRTDRQSWEKVLKQKASERIIAARDLSAPAD